MPSDCCSVRISRRISWRSCASRFDSGSSIRQTLVSAMIARPSATRCCWPPESCEGFLSSSAVRPSRWATRARRWSKPAAGSFRTLTPNRMFSRTLRCGNSAYDWNTIEIRRSAGSKAGDVAAVDQDPAFRRRVEAGDHAQRRRLAAARRPEQDHQLARGGGEARAVDRLGAAPVLADAFEAERAHAIVRERRRPGCIALVSVPRARPGQPGEPQRRASRAQPVDSAAAPAQRCTAAASCALLTGLVM